MSSLPSFRFLAQSTLPATSHSEFILRNRASLRETLSLYKSILYHLSYFCKSPIPLTIHLQRLIIMVPSYLLGTRNPVVEYCCMSHEPKDLTVEQVAEEL